MKRLLLLLAITIGMAIGAEAQTGLEINSMFGGAYVADKGVTEIQMSGNQRYLREYRLSALAIFKGPAEKYASKIEKLVLADGSKAVGRNVRYREGHLQYACFSLPAEKVKGKPSLHRYIYYFYNKNTNPATVLLVYMEGYIDTAKAERIFISYT
ncbi:MAG: hypothetical protein K2K55_01740 [Duncaniella sp.]|nr:hypothetical protein [Duncaniella sp.]